MQGLAALLVMGLSAGGSHSRPPLPREATLQAVAHQAVAPAPLATPVAADDRDALPPPCAGDVCQPQVALPGYTPRFTTRGARTRLTLEALDAARLEPAATVAWWLAGTGLRFDYTPAALDAATTGGGVGVASYRLVLGWRIDAFGAPVWLERRR